MASGDSHLHDRPISRVAALVVAVLVLIAVVLLTGVVRLSNLSQVTTGVIVVASAAYFVIMLTNSRVTPTERSRVRAFIPLFVANAVFWSLFQRIFTVLAVYSDERMNWSIFDWTAPSNWIGSIEPVWIIVLSPVFAIMWTQLGTRAPTTPRKFAYGVIGMGLAFLLFLPMAGTTGKAVPALLVVGIMAVFAISELLISPIGLAVTTKLAPEAFRRRSWRCTSSPSASARRCPVCWRVTTIPTTNSPTSASSEPSRSWPAWWSSR